MNKNVFVIAGPTSSGKTSLAIELCSQYGGEIISADSRQIYRYMDIGTGKAPLGGEVEIEREIGFWTINGIKVWGYDLTEPGQYFSAYDFYVFAHKKLSELSEDVKNIFLVGGTGFYIDSVTGRRKLDASPPDFELRSELGELSTVELRERLTKLDPKMAESIDMSNPARLTRAIEKAHVQKQSEVNGGSVGDLYNFVHLGLTAGREFLYSRADAWVDAVWEGGIESEVKGLIERGYGNAPQMKGLVYKTVVSCLAGEIDRNPAIQKCKWDVHAYIRRQQTWFKKNTDILWFDISENSFRKKIADTVQFYLRR